MSVRNVVVEMNAHLVAVKPARDPDVADFGSPPVEFVLV
jgi:hypothetical protein